MYLYISAHPNGTCTSGKVAQWVTDLGTTIRTERRRFALSDDGSSVGGDWSGSGDYGYATGDYGYATGDDERQITR